jgi:hypothetical protein
MGTPGYVYILSLSFLHVAFGLFPHHRYLLTVFSLITLLALGKISKSLTEINTCPETHSLTGAVPVQAEVLFVCDYN